MTPSPEVERNVDAIASLEQSALARRTAGDRLSNAIARFCGSLRFVILQACGVAIWIILNRPASSHQFDPYPYNLLMVIVSLEAISLSTFVLMNQNHMSRLAERRAHLNLQISLLAESEMTKVLNTLQAMTTHLGMSGVDDEEMRDLSQRTRVEHVAQALEEKLPTPESPPPGSR